MKEWRDAIEKTAFLTGTAKRKNYGILEDGPKERKKSKRRTTKKGKNSSDNYYDVYGETMKEKKIMRSAKKKQIKKQPRFNIYSKN